MACERNSAHTYTHAVHVIQNGSLKDKTSATFNCRKCEFTSRGTLIRFFRLVLFFVLFFANAMQREVTPTMYHYTQRWNVVAVGDLYICICRRSLGMVYQPSAKDNLNGREKKVRETFC